MSLFWAASKMQGKHRERQISAQAGRLVILHGTSETPENARNCLTASRSACILTKRSEAANVRPGRQVLCVTSGVARPFGDAYEGIAQSHAIAGVVVAGGDDRSRRCACREIRAARRSARQGRRLGAVTAGAGRPD